MKTLEEIQLEKKNLVISGFTLFDSKHTVEEIAEIHKISPRSAAFRFFSSGYSRAQRMWVYGEVIENQFSLENLFNDLINNTDIQGL